MPANESSGQKTTTQPAKPANYQELVKQVADRVWELWREDLRRGRERQGRRGKK